MATTQTKERLDILTEPQPAYPLTNGEQPERNPALRTVGHLAGALATAQGRCQAATKDGEVKGGKVRFKYATSASVLATAGEALDGTGLTLIPCAPCLEVVGSGNVATYAFAREFILAHESGECIPLGTLRWPVSLDGGMTLQKAFAAADTLSLAYTYRDLLRMPSADAAEDDAQRQQADPPRHAPPQEATPAAPQPTQDRLTDDAVTILSELLRDSNVDVTAFLKHYGAKSIIAFPPEKYREACLILRGRVEGQKQTIDHTRIDRLHKLLEVPGVDWKHVSARLNELYGVSTLAGLTVAQADDLEQKIRTAKAVQGAKVPNEKQMEN